MTPDTTANSDKHSSALIDSNEFSSGQNAQRRRVRTLNFQSKFKFKEEVNFNGLILDNGTPTPEVLQSPYD